MTVAELGTLFTPKNHVFGHNFTLKQLQPTNEVSKLIYAQPLIIWDTWLVTVGHILTEKWAKGDF